MQTHIPLNSLLPHLLSDWWWWHANANQPRSAWQRWYKVLEVTLRKTVCHTKRGWMAYRFIQSRTLRRIPRQVTDNACSCITKWINYAVFLISVPAAQIRKLVGGEERAAPEGVIFRRQGLGDQTQANDLCFRRFCCCWIMTNHLVFWLSFTDSTLQLTIPPTSETYLNAIWEFLGSASFMSQKMRRKSAFSRLCMWIHAQHSSSEMRGNCGSLSSFTTAPFENSRFSCSILHLVLLART